MFDGCWTDIPTFYSLDNSLETKNNYSSHRTFTGLQYTKYEYHYNRSTEVIQSIDHKFTIAVADSLGQY